MKKTRVIIINPNDRTITEQMIEVTLKELYRIIGCDTIEASYSGIIYSKTGNFLYVDEEGTFKKDKNYFHITGAHSPLTGIGILLKHTQEGDEADCSLSVDELLPHVKFYTEQEVNDIYRHHSTTYFNSKND